MIWRMILAMIVVMHFIVTMQITSVIVMDARDAAEAVILTITVICFWLSLAGSAFWLGRTK